MGETIKKIINKILFFLIKSGIVLSIKGTNKKGKKYFTTLDSLIDFHFNFDQNHICKETLKTALSLINKEKSGLILIETGSSAYGTDSTNLFDLYLHNFYGKKNGKLLTCDNRINPLFQLYRNVRPNTTMFIDDSIHFLKKISEKYAGGNQQFFIYLDSFGDCKMNSV